MTITRLTTYTVPPRWLFLKVGTDVGIVGWGEPVLEGRAAAVMQLDLASLRRIFGQMLGGVGIGHNPSVPKY